MMKQAIIEKSTIEEIINKEDHKKHFSKNEHYLAFKNLKIILSSILEFIIKLLNTKSILNASYIKLIQGNFTGGSLNFRVGMAGMRRG